MKRPVNIIFLAVDLKSGSGKIVEGTIDGVKPGVTLTIDDEDMFLMVTGKLDPQKVTIYLQICIVHRFEYKYI